jgi:hypothetical protein
MRREIWFGALVAAAVAAGLGWFAWLIAGLSTFVLLVSLTDLFAATSNVYDRELAMPAAIHAAVATVVLALTVAFFL